MNIQRTNEIIKILRRQLLPLQDLHPQAVALRDQPKEKRITQGSEGWTDYALTVLREEMGEVPKKITLVTQWQESVAFHTNNLLAVLIVFATEPELIKQLDISKELASDLADVFDTLSSRGPLPARTIQILNGPNIELVSVQESLATISNILRQKAQEQ